MSGWSRRTCSKDPIISVVLVLRLRTGLIILAGEVNRNRPGYRPFRERGMRPISRVPGTWKQRSKRALKFKVGERECVLKERV